MAHTPDYWHWSEDPRNARHIDWDARGNPWYNAERAYYDELRQEQEETEKLRLKFNAMSEKEQIQAIQQDSDVAGGAEGTSSGNALDNPIPSRSAELIRYIDNPSERVQLAAVQKYGMAIRFIENPSERVQLAAVEQTGYALVHIRNPSERVQLAAIESAGRDRHEYMNMDVLIDHIENPSEEVISAAKRYDPNFRPPTEPETQAEAFDRFVEKVINEAFED